MEALPLSPLEGLNYDPKDHTDIFPYEKAFEEIRKKIGQNLTLHKLGEGAWANIFEIQKEGKGVYVAKLPHPEYLNSEDINLKEKVKAEIELQRKFILKYDILTKEMHKKYLNLITSPATSSLYATLSGKDYKQGKNDPMSPKKIQTKEQLATIKNIQIPRLLDIYQGELPIIVMDKIPGVSLRFEIMSSVFSPLFESYYSFGSSDALLIKSDKTLCENCKEQGLSDKDIAHSLKILEKGLLPKIGKTKLQQYCINSGMLESDPDIMIGSFIKEFDKVWEPDPTIFTQLYGEEKKGKILQKAYDLFLEKFPKHPDPNLHNFIITPDHKLGIIDFG